jgi:hypothetical protein
MPLRWLLLIAIVTCAACSRGAAPGLAGASGRLKIEHREVASLREIGAFLPPVDEGRLQAAPPAGWNVLPRGKSYLIGFAKGKPSELPRIVINTGDPPEGAPSKLSEDNAADFAATENNVLRAAAKAGQKKVAEYVRPIVLGEIVYVQHVRHAQLGHTPCIILSLVTIHDGRLYTVELISDIDAPRPEEYDRSLAKWRGDAYAVAAHLRFAPSGEKLDSLPAKDEPN